MSSFQQKQADECPFYIHRSGQYAKKIAGRTRYFGHVRDGLDAAMQRLSRERPYWERGFTPPAGVQSRLTLRQLLDAYLLDYKERSERGEVSPRSWRDARRTCQMVVDFFGGDLPAEGLDRSDWDRLRSHWVAKYAPVVSGNHIRRIRAALRWSGDPGPLEKSLEPGRSFRPPAIRLVRQAKAKRGLSLVSPMQMMQLLAKAHGKMRAAILLGANCAFHTCDVGRLLWSDLDLDAGWYRGTRQKTGIERKARLWPETVRALQVVQHKGELVFVSRVGTPLYDESKQVNAISRRFTDLSKGCGLDVRFKDFRSTFQTLADDLPHQLAVKCVMGHAGGDISSVYRQLVSDERVTEVCEHVRQLLLLGNGHIGSEDSQMR